MISPRIFDMTIQEKERLNTPMALLKFSMSASVFLTSAENTSLPTMGQNGTFVPSSCDIANAKAVLPVPGPPASKTARPAIFFALIRSTTTPQACMAEILVYANHEGWEIHSRIDTSRAAAWPTKPPLIEVSAVPDGRKPRPLMCVCVAVRF